MPAACDAAWTAVRRPPAVPILFAIALLTLPFTVPPAPTASGAPWTTIEVLALVGIAAGWLFAHLAVAIGVPRWLLVLVVVLAIGTVAVALLVLLPGRARILLVVVPSGLAAGMLIRGTRARHAGIHTLVPAAALALWLVYDLGRLPNNPLSDMHLYLAAGRDALAGRPLYLEAPLTAVPPAREQPFVYPPPTIPLFAFLASLPIPLVEVLWFGASVTAATAGLWLLGVRGRWLVCLLAWPPLALGIGDGNVATFGFFLFALAYRVTWALLLPAMFKPQSVVAVLWLLRERRWRNLAAPVAIVLVLCLVTAPLTGLAAWPAWLGSLGPFQATTDAFQVLKGLSLTRHLPTLVVVVLVAAAVVAALLVSGRRSLARFGIASVVASPTLYLHGLAPMLPGALSLRSDVLWLVLGLSFGLAHPAITWLSVAIVAGGLLLRTSEQLDIPGPRSPADVDLHPLGDLGRVWPDRNG